MPTEFADHYFICLMLNIPLLFFPFDLTNIYVMMQF
jgi:hypothetical protein